MLSTPNTGRNDVENISVTSYYKEIKSYGGIVSSISYFRPDCLHLERWSTIVDDGGCDEIEKEVQRAHLTR